MNRVFWLIWLLPFVLVGCQATTLQQIGTSGTSEWSGALQDSAVWSHNVLVRGPVTVPQGRTLTIQPGAVVLFQQDEAGRPAALIIEGSLYVEGGEREEDHIVLAAVDQSPANWQGIRFLPNASVSRLSFSRIFNAEVGLYAESSDVLVDHTLITGCRQAAIICDNASVRIEYNQIQKNGTGIECRGEAAPTIAYNEISTNDRGIVCTDGARPLIQRNVIQANLEEGIWVAPPAQPIVEENNILRNGRWAVYGGGKLSGNFLQGNNQVGPLEIDTGTGRSSSQYFEVEEVQSPRQAPVPTAGPYQRR